MWWYLKKVRKQKQKTAAPVHFRVQAETGVGALASRPISSRPCQQIGGNCGAHVAQLGLAVADAQSSRRRAVAAVVVCGVAIYIV